MVTQRIGRLGRRLLNSLTVQRKEESVSKTQIPFESLIMPRLTDYPPMPPGAAIPVSFSLTQPTRVKPGYRRVTVQSLNRGVGKSRAK